MGTHASIGKVNSDGTVTSIYLHYDGYRSHCGVMLKDHYNTEEKVDALLALGALSSINPEIGEPHSFDYHYNEHKDWCLAYHRDRGEAFRQDVYRNKRQWELNAEEYGYIWENGSWNIWTENR
jgi:hypothetical protein